VGHGTDVFTANSGSTFWTRPVDTATLPIKVRIVGGNGSATLRKYGSGEPDIPPGQTPGTPVGSRTNPDVFLHDSTYQEPIYETRLECNPGFAWRNAACALPPITDAVHQRVAAATGIIVQPVWSLRVRHEFPSVRMSKATMTAGLTYAVQIPNTLRISLV
jgi:hypothetical protein